MAHPQTIQIFLPDGDPQGIRIAAITTRIVQVIEIPRARLSHFLTMREATHVGVYWLFGEDEETGQPKAYIGQTSALGARLKQHHDGKDFWNRALVALSLTHSLTVTHAHYLEWQSINRAIQAHRYALINGTAGSRPHAPAALDAECREIFETIGILLTTLGYPVFETLIKQPPSRAAQDEEETRATASSTSHDIEIFLRNDRAQASGRYTETGLVVLAGSWGRAQMSTQSITPTARKKREYLIESGELEIVGERLYFRRDVSFSSPSAAGDMVNGRATNGWTEWKNEGGKTLSEVMGRKQPTASTHNTEI
ncbi:DUF4357 domain-containing protein [Asaia sp. W19]|uniref:GIY-YIG nuclease family protein n=1 Tax=unclassified Asaia TaxID=2685023 RepID=UPI000F8E1A88|nr:DUF4357 domain-containing protein [Asaia sp. W19]RUT25124.1 DUF4357 domain-containing protein [Asaia sp. W19]